MRTRRLALWAVLMVLVFPTAAWAAERPGPQLVEVFQLPRSDKEDVIYFRNKDVLRGRVTNETVTIATQYGALKIPIRLCAGLSFEGARANTEAVVTVNFNRITGIITDRVITFRIGSSGAEIPVRKEKVRFLLLQRTANENDFLEKNPNADLFLMANGDLLSGEAAERKITIATDYAKVPVGFDEMVDVQMQGGDNITAIINKKNKDILRGTLDTDELTIDLDIGVQVPVIYKDKFARFFVDRARAEAPAQFGVQQPAGGESDGVRVPPFDGAKAVTLKLAEGVEMKLVLIPAGKFLMGSPLNEEGRDADEGPQKTVTITRPFYMGVHEVTQAQYSAIMGANPSQFKEWTHPVEQVSWNDAADFCKKLSETTGQAVRLPTEAEWEYACRAGTRTPFHTGDTISTDQANYDGNETYGGGRKGVYRQKTVPVGSFAPNAWGLYDMHGNVWEWCSDWYAGEYTNAVETDPQGPKTGESRVLRGGSWLYNPRYCRSATRNWDAPGTRNFIIGFRVVVSGAGVD